MLGIWVQAAEGAKFWASVCAQLANRGLRDVLIVCCDGLTGFPEAIEATWPGSLVQTCVVHLIRASMRYVAYADRKAVAAALRPVYAAVDADAALAALVAFADSALGKKYPAAVATWENAWDRFIPFLDFGPATRGGDLHHQQHRVVELPAAQDHPRTGATSPSTRPPSICCGWRSATIKGDEGP